MLMYHHTLFKRRVPVFLVLLGTGISYEDGLKRQNAAVEAILEGTGGESLFLLEHAPVYTIGRLRDQSSLRVGTVVLVGSYVSQSGFGASGS